MGGFTRTIAYCWSCRWTFADFSPNQLLLQIDLAERFVELTHSDRSSAALLSATKSAREI